MQRDKPQIKSIKKKQKRKTKNENRNKQKKMNNVGYWIKWQKMEIVVGRKEDGDLNCRKEKKTFEPNEILLLKMG